MPSSNVEDKARHRIDEELVSVDSLRHVLCTRCGCKDVQIHREQCDPPDFMLTIDGVQFPTEVTSIVLEQHQQDYAHCDELTKAIQNHAEELGILSGQYALVFLRSPNIPKSASKEGRRLIKNAVNYIETTKQQSQSAEISLATDELGETRIWKLTSFGSTIAAAKIPTARLRSEIRNELVKLIQNRIDTKGGFAHLLAKRPLGIERSRSLCQGRVVFCYTVCN